MIKGKIRRLNLSPETSNKPVEEINLLLDAQEVIIHDAEENEEKHIQDYNELESSFNGKYICADLMKETFPIYTKSIDSRKRFSEVVHNSCACLAAEAFERQAKKMHDEVLDNQNDRKKCIFLTGVPGAGKSYLIQSIVFSGVLGDNIMVYEGDITTPSIKEKMQLIKDLDMDIMILVVNPTLELAQANAIRRHFEIGRGASSQTMARIMSKLPNAVRELSEEFDFTLGIFNKKTNYDTYSQVGFEHVDTLEHGTYDEILANLLQLREELLPTIREEFEKKKLADEEIVEDFEKGRGR